MSVLKGIYGVYTTPMNHLNFKESLILIFFV